jgi:hypothetical protein
MKKLLFEKEIKGKSLDKLYKKLKIKKILTGLSEQELLIKKGVEGEIE